MRRASAALAALLLAAAPALAADPYTVKVDKADVPKDVAEPVAKLLGKDCIQLQENGQAVCNLWLRQEVPSIGTAKQAENGLTYRELPETALLGVLQVVKEGYTDYRKQKIAPGTYTLRLGFQPQDGDHMGTAPFNEFCLLAPAADDKKPDPLENAKALVELSLKASKSSHPAVLLLFPGKPVDTPAVAKAKDAEGHWLINTKVDAVAEGKKYKMGLSLTLIGHSAG